MSLIWTLIDGFLLLEIVFIVILTLPIFGAASWNRLFKSKFLATFSKKSKSGIYLIIAVLLLVLLEAIREVSKYTTEKLDDEVALDVRMQHSMRLFRAQRNFYISGFTIFLVLIIKRLVALISEQASLAANCEASLKQAKSVSTVARNLISNNQDGVDNKKSEDKDINKNKISQLKERIHELTTELNREKKDKEALKSQAESLNKEYDRLTEEYSKLQKKITIGGTEGGSTGGKGKED